MANNNYSFFSENMQGTLNEDTGDVVAWQKGNYRNHIEFKIDISSDDFKVLTDKQAKKDWISELAEKKFNEIQTNKRQMMSERRRQRLKRLKPASEQEYKTLFVDLMNQLKGADTSPYWDELNQNQVVMFDSKGNPDSVYNSYQEALNNNYSMILKGVDDGFLKFNNKQLKILNLDRLIVEKSFKEFLNNYDFDYELLTRDTDVDYIIDNPTTTNCWEEAVINGEEVVLRLVDLQNENRDHIQDFRFMIDENLFANVLLAMKYYMNVCTIGTVKQAINDKCPDIDTKNMTNEELADAMMECQIPEEFNNFCYVVGKRKLDFSEVEKDYQRLNLKLHPEYSLDKLHRKERDISNSDQNDSSTKEVLQ